MEPFGWFTLVFLVLLKIPVLYLCYVVWWAVKDPPAPGDSDEDAYGEDLDEPGGGDSSWWTRRARRPHRRGPHGTPIRRPSSAPAKARSKPPA